MHNLSGLNTIHLTKEPPQEKPAVLLHGKVPGTGPDNRAGKQPAPSRLHPDFRLPDECQTRERECDYLKIEYSKKAVKYINSVDKPTKKRLREAMEKIPLGDIKKLQGIENGYRLRAGDLRVLFSIGDDTVYVDNIIPRGQAYKRI